jgi:malate synthase
MDAGLFVFHNALELIERGHGPYLYLPKLEHYLEARWWSEVLTWCEDRLQLERGTIKTTVLIETLPAGFQMDEILYELRERMVGLNCGRWDYIFSYIKVLRNHSDRVLPDRAQVGMAVGFLRNYSHQLIRTCHRRGVLAMGGMAAQIPVKGDDQANQVAFDAVRADKQREANNGHDGTWVAHPGLIPLAMEVFNQVMPEPNQMDRMPEGEPITRDQLLVTPPGSRTEVGGRANVDVAIRYLASWLCGRGCVPIHHLMEDAATAEIARAQLWQWVHHQATLDDGSVIDIKRVREWIESALATIEKEVGARGFSTGRYGEAADLVDQLVRDSHLADFLTLLAYPMLEDNQHHEPDQQY